MRRRFGLSIWPHDPKTSNRRRSPQAEHNSGCDSTQKGARGTSGGKSNGSVVDLVVSMAGAIERLQLFDSCHSRQSGGSRTSHPKCGSFGSLCYHLKVNAAKHRTRSLFGQGSMLYELISNRPEVARGRSTADFQGWRSWLKQMESRRIRLLKLILCAPSRPPRPP